MNRLTRRRFLGAMAAGGALYAFGRTPGTVMAHAAGVGGFSDYKALVCVYLAGGNDSWSMVVPRTQSAYDAYAAARQNLAIPRADLLSISPSGLSTGSYGMHPAMGRLRNLFDANRCAVVANVGPLLVPTSKPQYQARSVPLPPQLFSHKDQEGQWLSLRGLSASRTGWAGRLADVIASQLAAQPLPTNVSISGNTLFQAGVSASPYVMSSAGALKFGGSAERTAVVQRIASLSYDSMYARGYAGVQKRAIALADKVNEALAVIPTLATAFPTSPLGRQLETVARMIASRDRLDMSRQVFYVAAGGFDTHNDQLLNQPGLLADVSNSLAAFHAATVELGVSNSVTAFTQSEFGRTLTSNGDGSDHGWGGVQLVVGDSVRGRRFYGKYPSLQLGGADDAGAGRIVPTVSCDQYAATLARWFGAEPSRLPEIAPHIGSFPVTDLGFML